MAIRSLLVKFLRNSFSANSPASWKRSLSVAPSCDPLLQNEGDSVPCEILFTGNALKFTERGEVTVRVMSVATQHTELAPIHFIIRDNGIGIPMEKQAAIFESFTQADGSVARRFARRSDTTATPLRILVAEDNATNQRVVVGILGKAGHSTTLVSNGREALASFNREPFDLILMDAQMPDMDGFEAMAAIRAGEKRTGSHVPIVV